jgi:hypothetical protein
MRADVRNTVGESSVGRAGRRGPWIVPRQLQVCQENGQESGQDVSQERCGYRARAWDSPLSPWLSPSPARLSKTNSRGRRGFATPLACLWAMPFSTLGRVAPKCPFRAPIRTMACQSLLALTRRDGKRHRSVAVMVLLCPLLSILNSGGPCLGTRPASTTVSRSPKFGADGRTHARVCSCRLPPPYSPQRGPAPQAVPSAVSQPPARHHRAARAKTALPPPTEATWTFAPRGTKLGSTLTKTLGMASYQKPTA